MNLSMTRRQMIAGASLGGLGAMSSLRDARAATTWSAYTYVPVGSVASVRGLQMMIDQFSQATNGEVKAQLHLGGSLPIAGTDITQAVSENIVQLAEDGLSTGNIPIIGLLRLPMLLLNYDEMIKAMAIMKPYIDAAYAQKNCVTLGQFTYPAQVIFGHKKIASLDNIAGKKIRVSSVEQGVLIKTFGGTPITMSPPQVPSALEEGVIDGTITASSGGGIGLEDLLSWRYGLPTSFVNSTYIINKSAFDRLTPTQQAALQKIGTATADWANKEFERQEILVTQKMVQNGMHQVTPTKADIQLAVEKLSPYWPQWAAAHGAEAQAALAKIRAAVGR
jgi:TRAP-type transport system periplasmic protein